MPLSQSPPFCICSLRGHHLSSLDPICQLPLFLIAIDTSSINLRICHLGKDFEEEPCSLWAHRIWAQDSKPCYLVLVQFERVEVLQELEMWMEGLRSCILLATLLPGILASLDQDLVKGLETCCHLCRRTFPKTNPLSQVWDSMGNDDAVNLELQSRKQNLVARPRTGDSRRLGCQRFKSRVLSKSIRYSS